MLKVSEYQRNLKYYYAYYKGSIDGKAGRKTKAAVRRFQKANALRTDGIYGKNTDKKLVAKVKDLQKELNDKGKYDLAVDGIIGSETVKAIMDYQRYMGLKADGIAGVKTFKALNKGEELKPSGNKADWSKVKYFKKEEFKCGCGGKYCSGYPKEMSPNLIYILEELRKYFGKPIVITSGLRCSKHNAKVGGVSNSAHKSGKAADIYIKGVSRARIKSTAYALGAKYSYYGTKGMGQAVHINV